MKQYFYLLFTILMGVSITNCGGNSNSDDSNAEIERLRAEIAELKAQLENQETEEQSVNSTITTEQEIKQTTPETSSVEYYVGNYTIKDDSGTNYKLTINSDETVTLEGPTDTFYGSADVSSSDDNSLLHIDFGYVDAPNLIFPSGKQLVVALYMDPSKDYVYHGVSDYKSKNPKLRLKLN